MTAPSWSDVGDWVLKTATDYIDKRLTPGTPTIAPCPPPTIWDPNRQICVAPGSPADVSMTDVTDVQSGGPIAPGMFGLLSTEPLIVGEINGRPVRRCPYPGTVLGKNNRCYAKGGKAGIPAKFRKHPPRSARCGPNERRIKDLAKAAAAAKSLKGAFKGSGYVLTKSGSGRRKK